MNERDQARVAELLEQFAELRIAMATLLAKCAIHKQEHGVLPKDTQERFQALSRQGYAIRDELAVIRRHLESPLAGVVVPDSLPEVF